MKIAEIINKKNKQTILLTFDDLSIIDQLKKLSGFIYYSQVIQYYCNVDNIRLLKNLNFDIIYDIDQIQIKADKAFLDNNYIHIYCNDIVQYKIIKMFTVFDYSNCYKYGKFDIKKAIKKEFYIKKRNKLLVPIGLKDDLSIAYNDIRDRKQFNFADQKIAKCLGYLSLYDYQVEIVKKCLKENGIIKSVTGSGKTEMFLALIKLINLDTIILTTSIDLARQTYNRAKKAKLDVGLVQGNNIDNDHKIIVATVQSSHKIVKQFKVIVVDECHQISDIHEKILSNKKIKYRFGFSATPFLSGNNKLKNTIIKQFIGPIIYEMKSKTLQENNQIAIPYINIIKMENKELYQYNDNNDWKIIEKLFIIENYERNMRIINLCKEIKTQKIILVKKIKHGKILKKLLEEYNIKSIFLEGNIDKLEREKVLKEFDKNKNKFILIGSKILFTGISLQNIFNLFYVAGGKSNIEVLQSLGRGLRSKTKTTVNIYDFNDLGNYIVENHSRYRLKYYKKEGFNQINFI